ncbi:hypothetical protein DL769_010230 [Monosporascus sp. CRB-8-3]|nr:hypothetical protein DL769_010230 [Monosporascus sp. CRB-8-3]
MGRISDMWRLALGQVWKIIFADINEHGAQDAAEKGMKFATNGDYRALAIKVDITEEDSVQAMVDTAVKELGRIDYSVNNAGVSELKRTNCVADGLIRL